ncbi:uncharacterized protein N7496_006628 [Penicillium cataractarum]|uniref:Xylanolytic transcriptional activator regulatory domain-containing protein n=1 Tax=Penicillium cataractarum TaxID=2100454 RepID=A0A9W9S1Z7_9EURO|nr:uncharacterized protein N7496_006628 [Penicillium cataractarum]KAJ5370536.1 hypothetical protein N7496_006628 [Penicillium cataractarum]
MTKGLGLRQYRACVRCRSRKTRQGIGDPNKPPCVKCDREGAECVLATSRRGGNYSHLRRQKKQFASERHGHEDARRFPRPEPALSISSPENASLHSATPGDHVHDNLQNPSDALLILAHAAGQPEDQGQSQANRDKPYSPGRNTRNTSSRQGGRQDALRYDHMGDTSNDMSNTQNSTTTSHPLIHSGTIQLPHILDLLSSYRDCYHPFFPIVPTTVLNPSNIQETLHQEPFLTTAILVIASKDRPDLTTLHDAIWDYLRQRILDVVLGVPSTRHVGCVEGLLLLGEWTLLNFGQADDGGGEAAWSILGLAVRLAYRLRLEDSGFRGEDNELDPIAQRKRLAWTFTYLSDRQISIRMGQAFWCRGPALSVRFIAQDFPTLQPRPQSSSSSSSTEDYASWIQAQVELTTLFGNAHDILFASKSRTIELITRGDYVKYIDDTGKAMAAWQRAWSGIMVSRALRGCLNLMLEYLRLYVNAFAFQAVLYRASRVGSESNANINTNSGAGLGHCVNVNVGVRPGSSMSDLDFPDSTMASADARHIYQALDAAESLLRVFTKEFEERQLQCLPTRFYLYEIHSSVFLYKAHSTGAIAPSRYTQTTTLIQRFITLLQTIAIDDQHIASRYARLLHQLWFQRPRADTATEHAAADKPGLGVEARDALGVGGGGVGLDVGSGFGGGSLSLFEDAGIGLESFEGEGMEGFFVMPPVFPYDLSGVFR